MKKLTAILFTFISLNLFGQSESDNMFIKVEIPPSYAEGKAAMEKFISKQFKVSKSERALWESCDTCSLIVVFDTGIDGTLSNIRTVKGMSTTLDREAERVISKMPKWKPETVNGRAVKGDGEINIREILRPRKK
jgi:periplasmic protein TonB